MWAMALPRREFEGSDGLQVLQLQVDLITGINRVLFN